ncbi:MAG: hypothetical protein OEN01_04105 [Candidatus Krumholzibacteria bacterium]|nr:hypothetical protein [Candidatus Krumholzibacteria bacterium]
MRRLHGPAIMIGVITATLGMGWALGGCTYTQVASSPPDYVEYEPDPEVVLYPQEFEDLSYYGAWIETTPFGWVWRPSVSPEWQPYHHGHWLWSQWGWTWVSYEPFGWAAYHYGFWHYDPAYGWIWLPGDRWFPSRVSWLYYGDYVCWAPIPPPGYYIADPWDIHVDFLWVGVHIDHFVHSDIGRYNVRDLRSTVTRTPRSRVWRDAPDVTYIETRTKRSIRPVDIRIQKMTKGKRQYQKMILPPAEKRTVDRYRDRVGGKAIKKQPPQQRPTTPVPKKADPRKKPPAIQKPATQPPKKQEPKKRATKPTTNKTKKRKDG